jgi:hypothetical protein
MSEYIIKTVKMEEGKYNHQLCDEKGNMIKPDTLLENNRLASDFLSHYNVAIVPFMGTAKLNKLEVKIDINKNGN